MKKLSIVARDFHTEEHALGFYTSGDRVKFWGGRGAFWGSLWGMLFSDDEVASVSTAETAPGLADADEYLDLERLEQGVQRAQGTKPIMGRVLPRKGVHDATWTKILAQLAAPPSSTNQSGG